MEDVKGEVAISSNLGGRGKGLSVEYSVADPYHFDADPDPLP